MRNIISLFFITLLLISCGGSKKAVITSAKKPIRRTVVSTPVKEIKAAVPKTVKKPLGTIPYKDRVQNYIYEYVGIAKSEMAKFGIPASITLAQGILESGAGYGELTQKANNHFGIKCHDWEGERVYHDDDLSQECFRKYEKAISSFKDHSLFLKNRSRYAKLFEYKKDDYKSWAYGLRKAGYATDKKYPVKLINIIERYQLHRYDKQVLKTQNYTAPISDVDRVLAEEVTDTDVSTNRNTGVVDNVVVHKETSTKSGVYIVQKGDTLYSISRRHNIKVSQLKAYNNLKDNTISIGQELMVNPDEETKEF